MYRLPIARLMLPLIALAISACSRTPMQRPIALNDPGIETRILSSDQKEMMQNVKMVNVELSIDLPHNEDFRFQWLEGDYNLSAEDIALTALIEPPITRITIYGMQENNGTALASNITVHDLSRFLNALQQSTTLKPNKSLVITTANPRFALGILRDTKETIVLFNNLDTVDAKTGAYNGVYRVDYKRFQAEITQSINQYNAIQTTLTKHLTELVEFASPLQEMNGLQFGLKTPQLLSPQSEAHTLTLFLKNISNQPLLLANTIEAQGSRGTPPKATINITPKIPTHLSSIQAIKHNGIDTNHLIIKLAPNEEKLFPISIKHKHLNKIRLTLSATNDFPLTSNSDWTQLYQELKNTKLKELWFGIMSFDVPLLTIEAHADHDNDHKKIAKELLRKIQLIEQ